MKKPKMLKVWVAFDGRGRLNAVLSNVKHPDELAKLGWFRATLTLDPIKPTRKRK